MVDISWNRLDKEPDAAFALFVRWRDHALPRPTPREWCRMNDRPGVTWPRDFAWEDRGLGWDRYLDERRQSEVVSATQEMARRHIGVAQDFISAVVKSLQNYQIDLEQGVRMRPNEMSRMLDVASKLERISRGEATERVEGQNFEALSDEELATMEKMVRKATVQR